MAQQRETAFLCRSSGSVTLLQQNMPLREQPRPAFYSTNYWLYRQQTPLLWVVEGCLVDFCSNPPLHRSGGTIYMYTGSDKIHYHVVIKERWEDLEGPFLWPERGEGEITAWGLKSVTADHWKKRTILWKGSSVKASHPVITPAGWLTQPCANCQYRCSSFLEGSKERDDWQNCWRKRQKPFLIQIRGWSTGGSFMWGFLQRSLSLWGFFLVQVEYSAEKVIGNCQVTEEPTALIGLNDGCLQWLSFKLLGASY